MARNYEWDPRKAAANRRKHGISFEEALAVFGDSLAVIHSDPDHSSSEIREVIIGHSLRSRLLVVSFTEGSGTVRILSARGATTSERVEYEEGTNS